MADSHWPPQFESTLREHLPQFGPDQRMTADLTLSDHGLDSLATVNLLLALEDQFGVMVPDDLLTVTTFETPARLWAVFDGLLEARPAS